MQKLLTIDEVVELLNVSKPFIYKLTSTKQIPHYKVGNRVLFGLEDLEQWLEDNKVDSKKKAQNRKVCERLKEGRKVF